MANRTPPPGGALPPFVPPMLARLGDAFDSDKHLFEWKWDGFRALIFRETDALRVRSRRDNDLSPRFPELSTLVELPPGVIVDGEIVVLEDGRPSFERVLQRERSRSLDRIGEMANVSPAFFVVFDLLYENFVSVMDRPLSERRSRLEALIGQCPEAKMVYSEGVVGAGLKLFEEAVAREFEGVVAKRLNSAYLSGQRTDAWTKFKKGSTILCVILGYLPDERGSIRSLIVATDVDGTLTCVGRVGSGITDGTRRLLDKMLPPRRRATPFVETSLEGEWIEPGIFCKVSYVEKTGGGMLRAPVFKELVME